MLVSCKFNGEKCSSKDFYYFHDYDYGSCYSFNAGKVNNATNIDSTRIDIKNVQKAGAGNLE